MTAHVTQAITCPDCQGTGDNPTQPWRPCGWCLGLGVMHTTTPHVPARRDPVDEPPGRDLDGAA